MSDSAQALTYEISIHVPRAGYDLWLHAYRTAPKRISIHVPRAGYDFLIECHFPSARYFYPRTPCGVRQLCIQRTPRQWYFYPRTPCGVRRDRWSIWQVGQHFYPRTPCGVRRGLIGRRYGAVLFLSTYPVRGTTFEVWQARALLMNFYPRTPCGVRHQTFGIVRPHRNFYPRTPCGVRLFTQLLQFPFDIISIHVPRAGYDDLQLRQ